MANKKRDLKTSNNTLIIVKGCTKSCLKNVYPAIIVIKYRLLLPGRILYSSSRIEIIL